MPAGTYAENLMLQYYLQGATATRVTSWSVGLSTISTLADGTLGEFTDASYTRRAVVFAQQSSNTYTNTAAVSFGTMQTAKLARACFVVNGAGSLLLYGTLAASSTASAATDSFSFAAGSLKVVLS